MKTNIFEPKGYNVFKPIGIEITVETEDELLVLWAALNNSDADLLNHANQHPRVKNAVERNRKLPWRIDTNSQLFCLIDDIIEKLGIKK